MDSDKGMKTTRCPVYSHSQIQAIVLDSADINPGSCAVYAEFITNLSSEVLDERQRHILIPSIRALPDVRGDESAQFNRALKIADWAVRVILPHVYWVDSRELATSFIDLKPLADARTVGAAQKRLSGKTRTASGSRVPAYFGRALNHLHEAATRKLSDVVKHSLIAVDHIVAGVKSSKDHHALSDEYLIAQIKKVILDIR